MLYIQHQNHFIICQNFIKDYMDLLYIKEPFLENELIYKFWNFYDPLIISWSTYHNLELIQVSNENDFGTLDQFGFLSQDQKINILFKFIHFRSFLLKISNFGNW